MTSPAITDTTNRVKFVGDRFWWTIRARNARFVVLTRQKTFAPKGAIVYTIIDWRRGVRGPCNLIGNGWDFTIGTLEEAAELLLYALDLNDRWERGDPSAIEALESGEDDLSVEVSWRNNAQVVIWEAE